MAHAMPPGLTIRRRGLTERAAGLALVVIFLSASDPSLPAAPRQTPPDLLTACHNDPSPERQVACWADGLAALLENRGTGAAFETLAELYAREPNFAKSCHPFVHRLGAAAYRIFAAGGAIEASPGTTACDYGFYHGFIETLIATTGSLAAASNFCRTLDANLPAPPDTSSPCYHGIGHGLTNVHDAARWGDTRRIAAEALAICETASYREADLDDCSSGVFNGIAQSALRGQYGLAVNTDDPLWLCREQPERHQSFCYGHFARIILQLADGDLLAAADRLDDMPDLHAIHATVLLSNLAVIYGNFGASAGPGFPGIAACRSLRSAWRQLCVTSYVAGLIQNGAPGAEHVAAIAACRSLPMAGEQEWCFLEIVARFQARYTPARLAEICREIRSELASPCV